MLTLRVAFYENRGASQEPKAKALNLSNQNPSHSSSEFDPTDQEVTFNEDAYGVPSRKVRDSSSPGEEPSVPSIYMDATVKDENADDFRAWADFGETPVKSHDYY